MSVRRKQTLALGPRTTGTFGRVQCVASQYKSTVGPNKITDVFPGTTFQPNDFIFFQCFDGSNSCGTVVGTNATGVDVFNDTWKGASYGYVRYGAADTGTYGYTSPGGGTVYFALRNVDPAAPVLDKVSVGFYTGAITLPAMTIPTNGRAVLLMQFCGDGNRDPALTTVTPNGSFRQIPAITAYIGAWLYNAPAGSQTIRMQPDGTGGSGGDSWAAGVVLGGMY